MEPAIFRRIRAGVGALGISHASNRGVSNETRFALNLTGLLFVVLVWLGSVVASMVYACQPGNGGAVVMAMFAACIGYGFFREAVTQVAVSEDRYPLPRR